MQKELEQLGLTPNEARIYLTLLKTGASTTTPLIRSSGIHPSKVYEVLDRLIRKGLVSKVVRSKKKQFQAINPESLRTILHEEKNNLQRKERTLNTLIPLLKNVQAHTESKINVQIYEGIAGLKSLYEKIYDSLPEGGTQYIIGAPKLINEKMEGFLLDWHARRIKKGIHCHYIYNSDARKYGSIRSRMKNSEVRYLPPEIVSPVWIETYGDSVYFGHIKKNGAIAFLIEDKDIAKGYREYFHLMWKISTK